MARGCARLVGDGRDRARPLHWEGARGWYATAETELGRYGWRSWACGALRPARRRPLRASNAIVVGPWSHDGAVIRARRRDVSAPEGRAVVRRASARMRRREGHPFPGGRGAIGKRVVCGVAQSLLSGADGGCREPVREVRAGIIGATGAVLTIATECAKRTIAGG